MTRFIVLTGGLAALLCATSGCVTDGNQDWSRSIGGVFGGGQSGPVTEKEISAGLKEALSVGTQNVVLKVSKNNGYFSDEAIRIPLPGRLATIQSKMAEAGLSEPLDDLQLKMNRAAERAAPQAERLFLNAIRSMTISDAVGILNGGDTAATDFLQERTTHQLKAAFEPYVMSALKDVGALQTAENVAGRYLPPHMVSDVRDELAEYAVSSAIEGLFYHIAAEEKAIRQDPVRRTTQLLQRVFGE